MQQFNIIPRSRLCEELGISTSTIKRWMQNRHFPKPLKASGKQPLYDRESIINWMNDMEGLND
ncbi:helix-turn-helix domain-containing protein [Alphaproteobacteria bacterium]|nr:helix-turn-helix domain-containing protein [Alphaproteobacteria bacterium]